MMSRTGKLIHESASPNGQSSHVQLFCYKTEMHSDVL